MFSDIFLVQIRRHLDSLATVRFNRCCSRWDVGAWRQQGRSHHQREWSLHRFSWIHFLLVCHNDIWKELGTTWLAHTSQPAQLSWRKSEASFHFWRSDSWQLYPQVAVFIQLNVNCDDCDDGFIVIRNFIIFVTGSIGRPFFQTAL